MLNQTPRPADWRPLTTKQAAYHLGLSQYTLEAWRARGGGPRYMKMGRSVRYRTEDLDAFAAQSERSNTGEVQA